MRVPANQAQTFQSERKAHFVRRERERERERDLVVEFAHGIVFTQHEHARQKDQKRHQIVVVRAPLYVCMYVCMYV